MDVKAAKYITRCLMRFHGLTDWKLLIEPSLQFNGACLHRRKEITLSSYFIDHTDAAGLVDVVLHEIAHALLPVKHGHDEAWKEKCKEIGAKPKASSEVCVPGRYQSHCPVCGRFYTYYKKPRAIVQCTGCPSEPVLIFTDVTTLDVPENYGFYSNFVMASRKKK